MARFNPRGDQRPSRFRLMLWLFMLFTTLIILFGVMSQPLAIIGDVLSDSYPDSQSGSTEGKDANSGLQTLLPMALGVTVVVGIGFLFAFYAFKNMGGGKDSFG